MRAEAQIIIVFNAGVVSIRECTCYKFRL